MKETLNLAPQECPGCGSVSFTANPDGSLVCDYCHAAYVPPERACPVCGATHEPDARRCSFCGVDLVRECPACGASNPLPARKCLTCGQRLEILEPLFDRVTGKTADWLRQMREGAPAIKAQEEAASQARLTEMWAIEAHRCEALELAQAERERQERTIIAVIATVVVLIIVAMLVVLVITSSGPSP